MLSDRDVSPEISDVVDEILGMFGAATETTAFASSTGVSYFIKNPQSLKRIREEFDG